MLRKNSPKADRQKIWLSIESGFLQQRLRFTRLALLGQGSTQVMPLSLQRALELRQHHARQNHQSSSIVKNHGLWQLIQTAFHTSLITAALVIAVLWWGPGIWQRLSGEATNAAYASIIQSVTSIAQSTGLPIKWTVDNTEQTLAVTPVAGQSGQNENIVEPEPPVNQSIAPADKEVRQLPAINPNLPVGDWLVIPKIGVRSQLQATANYEDALDTGLWRAPDFGKPGSLEMPMIVAGHRYGWKWWWQDEYWKYNSFNLLPELQVGDRVEVISEQRKWIYEIYAGEEGNEITDYKADLILYTCKYLQSPLRYFRYARLVEE